MIVLQPDEPVEAHPVWEYDDVELGGVAYHLRMRWNERQERWQLDIEAADSSRAVRGFKMVPNYPLGWRHTGRIPEGGFLMLVDMGDDEARAQCGYEDLGWRFKLLWIDDADVPAADTDRSWTITV
jgi:hypothetical protein